MVTKSKAPSNHISVYVRIRPLPASAAAAPRCATQVSAKDLKLIAAKDSAGAYCCRTDCLGHKIAS